MNSLKRIPEMNTEYQYMFLSSPPEKEAEFQQLKKKHGSILAFHGSAFGNWHSILRIGLKNFSNTELMSTGAAYGPGIYLCNISTKRDLFIYFFFFCKCISSFFWNFFWLCCWISSME